MARKNEILYVNFYTDGSAARKIAPAFPAAKPQKKVAAKRQEKLLVHVDPVAVCSLVVAVVMLVMMSVGLTSLQNARAEMLAMESYVQQLKAENAQLNEEFSRQVDLDEVEKTALALGMVPSEQAQTTPITVSIAHEPVVEETFWMQVTAFLTNLFA